MVRLLAMLFISMIVSGYYFPFKFSFFPVVNTKVVLAVISILLVVYQGCRKHGVTISKELMGAVGIVFIFSFLCLVAIDQNNTDDYAYVTYFFSFFTWLGGAYTVCAAIRLCHGKVTLRLLIGYLSFVCVAQCILSQLIDRIPAFKMLVDTYIVQGQSFFNEINRLYGIGASLDPAGVRFSVVLLLIAYLLCEDSVVRQSRKRIAVYLVSFFLISILGNMISRTTTVGMVMGLAYIMYSTGFYRLVIPADTIKFYSVFGSLLVLFVVAGIYLYQNDDGFYQSIRFAFEGFFKWVEKGQWQTDSTDKLKAVMWIWPENFKGWIIGTGLFDGWVYSTDIGYCRFILYCGLTGFSVFALFFVYNARVFSRKFPSFRLLSVCMLALSFVIWLKVATDLFLIYALFYCLDWKEEQDSEPLLE